MHTPGAMMSTSAPKFEKLAKVSSTSLRQVDGRAAAGQAVEVGQRARR